MAEFIRDWPNENMKKLHRMILDDFPLKQYEGADVIYIFKKFCTSNFYWKFQYEKIMRKMSAHSGAKLALLGHLTKFRINNTD